MHRVLRCIGSIILYSFREDGSHPRHLEPRMRARKTQDMSRHWRGKQSLGSRYLQQPLGPRRFLTFPPCKLPSNSLQRVSTTVCRCLWVYPRPRPLVFSQASWCLQKQSATNCLLCERLLSSKCLFRIERCPIIPIFASWTFWKKIKLRDVVFLVNLRKTLCGIIIRLKLEIGLLQYKVIIKGIPRKLPRCDMS